MSEIIGGISPTRMELLKLKRRVQLAEKGHDLLREKRDALIAEFLDIVEEVRDARKRVEEELEEAFLSLNIAKAIHGEDAIRQISFVTDQPISMDFDTRNIMGVKVPIVETEAIKRDIASRGYGFVDTSSAVDQCASRFEETLEHVIKLAELEETVRRLAKEVEKTKRRVNALEYIMIPRLKATTKYIAMRLEEMEREDFSRLKRIKAILER
jgi:V/A-type H+-transporting ATPase subunit D